MRHKIISTTVLCMIFVMNSFGLKCPSIDFGSLQEICRKSHIPHFVNDYDLKVSEKSQNAVPFMCQKDVKVALKNPQMEKVGRRFSCDYTVSNGDQTKDISFEAAFDPQKVCEHMNLNSNQIWELFHNNVI